MTWETVIGLEVHVQLKTRSKMFCGCSTNFGAAPNTNVCPVCLALPGALPVPNAEAIRLATLGSYALGCTVHGTSIFSRKASSLRGVREMPTIAKPADSRRSYARR